MRDAERRRQAAGGRAGQLVHERLETLDLMGNEIGVSGSRAISQLLAPGVDLDSFQVQDSRSVLEAFDTQRIG